MSVDLIPSTFIKKPLSSSSLVCLSNLSISFLCLLRYGYFSFSESLFQISADLAKASLCSYPFYLSFATVSVLKYSQAD